MSSKMLAFRVARPVEAVGGEVAEFSYDPRTQTAVWNGTGRASASFLYCTGGGTAKDCNAYGYYCTTWGGSGHYKCDE